MSVSPVTKCAFHHRSGDGTLRAGGGAAPLTTSPVRTPPVLHKHPRKKTATALLELWKHCVVFWSLPGTGMKPRKCTLKTNKQNEAYQAAAGLQQAGLPPKKLPFSSASLGSRARGVRCLHPTPGPLPDGEMQK